MEIIITNCQTRTIKTNISAIVCTDNGDGPWITWFNALKKVVETKDDYYGVIQDDVILCKNVIEYLNKISLPEAFSVFSPTNYKAGAGKRWAEMRLGGRLWMAQTMFFSRRAAESLLHSQVIWRVPGNKQIDNRIGLWAESVDIPVYYHTPSLAQHVGEQSTMWDKEKATLTGNRVANDFVGIDFNALDLLKEDKD